MIGFPSCDFGRFNAKFGAAVRSEQRFTVIPSSAHNRDDENLELIYIGRRFKNDTERLEKLFEMYTRMTTKVPA